MTGNQNEQTREGFFEQTKEGSLAIETSASEVQNENVPNVMKNLKQRQRQWMMKIQCQLIKKFYPCVTCPQRQWMLHLGFKHCENGECHHSNGHEQKTCCLRQKWKIINKLLQIIHGCSQHLLFFKKNNGFTSINPKKASGILQMVWWQSIRPLTRRKVQLILSDVNMSIIVDFSDLNLSTFPLQTCIL